MPGIAICVLLALTIAAEELGLFGYATKKWVSLSRGPRGEPIHNVLIVGGGQTGLAIAFGLKQERIDGVLALDGNGAELESPWVTFARMLTLRMRKILIGPDLVIPSLTYRAWHET